MSNDKPKTPPGKGQAQPQPAKGTPPGKPAAAPTKPAAVPAKPAPAPLPDTPRLFRRTDWLTFLVTFAVVWIGYYSMFPTDSRPMWIRWMYPQHEAYAGLRFDVVQTRNKTVGLFGTNVERQDVLGHPHWATQHAALRNEGLAVTLGYYRSNLPAFNRTYRKICNSLTIE